MLLVAVSMILCTTYIFGFEYYDRRPDRLQQLSKQINVPELKITEVGVELSGIHYGEKLDLQMLVVKENKVIEALGHEASCSKLCQALHYNPAEASIEETTNQIKVTAVNKEDETPYQLTIKNQKNKKDNTYYDLRLTSVDHLAQLDMKRSRAKDLFKNWGAKPKESIYFKAELVEMVSNEKRLALVETIFNNLKGKMTNMYQDDRDSQTVAYYGYTKEVPEYIEGVDGNKTNIQISFTYNEITDKTECIIGFPFYNAPF